MSENASEKRKSRFPAVVKWFTATHPLAGRDENAKKVGLNCALRPLRVSRVWFELEKIMTRSRPGPLPTAANRTFPRPSLPRNDQGSASTSQVCLISVSSPFDSLNFHLSAVDFRSDEIATNEIPHVRKPIF